MKTNKRNLTIYLTVFISVKEQGIRFHESLLNSSDTARMWVPMYPPSQMPKQPWKGPLPIYCPISWQKPMLKYCDCLEIATEKMHFLKLQVLLLSYIILKISDVSVNFGFFLVSWKMCLCSSLWIYISTDGPSWQLDISIIYTTEDNNINLHYFYST